MIWLMRSTSGEPIMCTTSSELIVQVMEESGLEVTQGPHEIIGIGSGVYGTTANPMIRRTATKIPLKGSFG